MPLERLYRENVRFDLAFIEAFADASSPKIAELNDANFVKNITCALNEESTEFTLGDPDTDASLSFCDAAGSQSATFKNPTVVLTGFKDEDRAATGVLNLFRDLASFPDVPYYAILRLGKRSDVPYAVNDRISLVRVKTDNGVLVTASGENAQVSNSALNDDFVNWGYKVLS